MDTSMITKGSCLCGEVTFQIEGEFDNFFICHCSYCRKDTGSAYAANLFINNNALTWLSGHDKIKNFNLKHTPHVKSFCADCGSALPIKNMNDDDCAVPAGSLDDGVIKKPDAHIYTKDKASWEDHLKSTKCFSGLNE
jgi:hypothetical protein